MTTSSRTDWMNHPELRRLVDDANRLTLAERITLVKGLIPGIADEQTTEQFAAFVEEMRLVPVSRTMTRVSVLPARSALLCGQTMNESR